MKVQHCDREPEVLEAVRSGAWASPLNDALRHHVADCPMCAEVMLVGYFLIRESAVAEAALPDAGLVWWKAQIRARREAAERAAQPIAIAEKLACVWGLLATAGVIVWQWTRLSGWVSYWLADAAGGAQAPSKLGSGSLWSYVTLQAFWGQHPAGLLVAALGIGLLVVASVLGVAWGER